MGHNGECQDGKDIENHDANRRAQSHAMTISEK